MHATQSPLTENPARAFLLLVARCLLGVIFFAHGWSKFTDPTIQATIKQFTAWQVPQPGVVAPLVAGLEVIGGACLVLGAYTWVVSVLLCLDMAGAIWFVHQGHGIFAGQGGWELPAALIAGLLGLAVASAGEWSYDAWANAGQGGSRSRSRRR